MVLAGCGGKTGFKPDSDVRNANEMRMRYSKEMINSRMSSWYNKDTEVGFPNANSTNGIVQPETEATWDYVPGVVAKGILDVWSLYQDSAWADAWYEGLAEWVEKLEEPTPDNVLRTATGCPIEQSSSPVKGGEKNWAKGGILDDLNCAKVYIGLYEGAKPGGKFENAERAAFYMEQMRLAAKGLEEHKNRYSIQLSDESLEFRDAAVNGGWMHKATDDPSKSYWGQMWCDGAYMGPALLAQLLETGACEGTTLGWNDVYKQFEASWPYLWDEEKQLPYHVLFTDVKTNKNGKAIYEAGHLYECKPTPDNVLRTATGSPIEQSSSPVKGREVLECSDLDYQTAELIGNKLILHMAAAYRMIKGAEEVSVPKVQPLDQRQMLLSLLPEEYEVQNLVTEAKSQGLSYRTATRWNEGWMEEGLVIKVRHGVYRKRLASA